MPRRACIAAAPLLLLLAGCPSRPGGPGNCLALNSVCALHTDCCSGQCSSGHCGCNPREGAPCSTSLECCSLGCSPTSGTCTTSSCTGLGRQCADDGECCAGLQCHPTAKTCFCGLTGSQCETSTDCCPGWQCRTGPGASAGKTCHPDAPQGDDGDCVDSSDCRAGSECVRTTAGAALGKCCTSKGSACGEANTCCAPHQCLSSSGLCGDCAVAGAEVLRYEECCSHLYFRDGGSLGVVCCLEAEKACAADGECCTGACKPTSGSSGAAVCCEPYGARCSASDPCCEGLVCDPDSVPPYGVCRVAPGQSCSGDVTRCADDLHSNHCPNGLCCQSQYGDCAEDVECCSHHCEAGSCEPARGPYEPCLEDMDCDYAHPFFGSSDCIDGLSGPETPQKACCPVRGERCLADSDCCDLNGTVCRVPTGGTEAVCCAPLAAYALSDPECCNGHVDALHHFCCLPFKSACSATAECCRAESLADTVECAAIGGVGGTVCCRKTGSSCAGPGDCCSNSCKKTGAATSGTCQ